MTRGPTRCAPLMDVLPWTAFTRLVDRQKGDRSVKRLAWTEPFRVRACAPRTSRERLRDFEVCLSAQAAKRYHLGFRHEITRATRAEANKTRAWHIHAELTQGLIVQARPLSLGDRGGLEGEPTTSALDSTASARCRSRVPEALFRPTQPAVTMSTRLDRRGKPPRFIHSADGMLGPGPVLNVLGGGRLGRSMACLAARAASAHAPRIAGRGTCSSSGSNSICVARSSTATRRKRCHRHAGSPCQARSSSP